MEKLVFFFSHIQSWQRSLILAGGLLFFWLLEGAIPFQEYRPPTGAKFGGKPEAKA